MRGRVQQLYEMIKQDYYLCSDNLTVHKRSYNDTLLFGTLTEIVHGNQLLFGGYGGGKTTSSEYLHSLFNGLPLDLVQQVALRGDPQVTEEKAIGRPDYGKLHQGKEEVIWQNFVFIGPKIIDEFNRIPEPNQSLTLNGVDRGQWSYLNDFINTGAQPFFATCNYADGGNTPLLPALIDRFDVAVEAGYCGVANEDKISDDYYNDKDQLLLATDITERILRALQSGNSLEDKLQESRKASDEFRQRLTEQNIPTFSAEEKQSIRKDITNLPLSKDARMYFLCLSADMNVVPKFGEKRANDGLSIEHGTFFSSQFMGSGSRRATKSLKHYAKALAWFQGKTEVSLEHITTVAPYVFWHRLQWSDDARRAFADEERTAPLDLHIAGKLLGFGNPSTPGVKKRFVESKDGVESILTLVRNGEMSTAEQLAKDHGNGGKGHPVFLGLERDIKQKNPHLDQIAKQVVGSNGITPRFRPRTIKGRFDGESYVKALRKLQEFSKGNLPLQHWQGDGLRPLTFRESIEALVTHYQSFQDPNDRAIALSRGFDTYSAVAVASGAKKFKLLPRGISDLTSLPNNFTGQFMDVPFSELSGFEFDRSMGSSPQTKKEALKSEVLLALLEEDKALRKEFVDIVYSSYNGTKALSINLPSNSKQDHLRPIYVNSVVNGASIRLNSRMNAKTSFLYLQK